MRLFFKIKKEGSIEMYYSPIILPTLCRNESFIRCVESLKKNTWADKTDLIIALDYPKRESHKPGYYAIKEYLFTGDFSAFKSIKIVERKRNYGAINNFRNLLKYCFSKYDRCICVFDDLELSHDFIQYMDKMLDAYADDQSAAGVIGYSYPVNWEVREGCNSFLQNFSGSIWGIGFWKSKFSEMSSYIEHNGLVNDFVEVYNNGRFYKLTDWARTDYVNAVCYGVAGKTVINQITDISIRIYLTVKDKKLVMPTVSKVRNMGFDGSGAFCEKIELTSGKDVCSQNYSYKDQPIDEQFEFNPIIDSQADMEKNRDLFNRFDSVNKEELSNAIERAKWYCSLGKRARKKLNVKKLFGRVKRGINNRCRKS
jgi:hypothetical protein